MIPLMKLYSGLVYDYAGFQKMKAVSFLGSACLKTVGRDSLRSSAVPEIEQLASTSRKGEN